MHQQLKDILSKYQSNKITDDQIGIALDILRDIWYFKDLEDQFGAEYLLMTLPLITVLVLRKAQTLMDQCDHYVLINGNLRAQAHNSNSHRRVPLGTLIDLKEYHQQTFVADEDCHLVRIKKSLEVQKQYRRLSERQRECIRELRQNEKLLTEEKQSNKEHSFLRVPFFNCLGRYDFMDLVAKSTLKQYSQSYVTHLSNKPITKIGCIIAGKIKLAFSMDENQEKRSRDREMQWNMSEGDWIGLEEYLGGELMKSSGQVDSVSAAIAWIPRQLFDSKFNVKTNRQVINRLISLMQTKRDMFQKSFNCLKRQYEIAKDNNRSMEEIKNELEKKISGLDCKAKRKRSFHRAKFAREFDIPSNIIHKVTNFEEIMPTNSLPKLKERVVLFAEEYAASLVNPSLQKELTRLENNKNRGQRSNDSSNRVDSPQKLYQTIYNKIAFQFETVQQRSLTKEKMPKKSAHYNFSIYNNFRVPKCLRPKEGEESRMKSLTVLPNLNEVN